MCRCIGGLAPGSNRIINAVRLVGGSDHNSFIRTPGIVPIGAPGIASFHLMSVGLIIRERVLSAMAASSSLSVFCRTLAAPIHPNDSGSNLSPRHLSTARPFCGPHGVSCLAPRRSAMLTLSPEERYSTIWLTVPKTRGICGRQTNGGLTMEGHKVVSKDDWVSARKQLLAKEKEFTRLRDQLSQQRRELPWERVDKQYIFEGPNGSKETLADLFAGRSQLVIYHFMFGPDWEQGCPSCSFWADNFNGVIIHLNHRDVTFAAISHAPIDKLAAFKQRMGWGFKWVSSLSNDFNYDLGVSLTLEQVAAKENRYI